MFKVDPEITPSKHMTMEGAVPPMGSPEPSSIDLGYASMEFEWQRAVVRPLAGKLGMPPGTVLFTLALFSSVPLGAMFQFIPGAAAKNLYSLASGEESEGKGVHILSDPTVPTRTRMQIH